ncbi:MAG: ROK family protein [Chloroflexota bacterium]
MIGAWAPALEVGGTHVAAGRVDVGARCVLPGSMRRLALDADGPANAILDTILACAGAVGSGPGVTWGVAVPGPFDYATGIARYEGVAKFGALKDLDVGGRLRDGLPRDSRVVFINDADAFVVGEWAAGAAIGHRRVVGITLGTGIGSAFLADGRPVTGGPDVPPDAEVHFLTIDGQSLEDVVSRRAIMARYARIVGIDDRGAVPDVHELAALARAGDHRAREAIAAPLRELGRALAPWLERFGATGLVVGGSIAQSWDLVEPSLRAGLPPAILPVRSQLGDDAALIGAALYAASSGA